jgi:hypothetical protein
MQVVKTLLYLQFVFLNSSLERRRGYQRLKRSIRAGNLEYRWKVQKGGKKSNQN